MAHQRITTATYWVGTCVKIILDHRDLLWMAVNSQVVLDIEYPIIYNKLIRFFEYQGVDFYGDVDEDYDILLHKLEKELQIS